MARWMLSFGMLASRARSTAARRRMLPEGSPPPAFAAMMISRASLLNTLPRCWSVLDFLILMLCHLECPDTAGSPPLRPDTRAPGAATPLYYNPATPGAQATESRRLKSYREAYRQVIENLTGRSPPPYRPGGPGDPCRPTRVCPCRPPPLYARPLEGQTPHFG